MAPDVIQLIQSYDHQSTQINWTSLYGDVTILALFFNRLPIFFLKTCLPELLIFVSSLDDDNMGLNPILPATNLNSPSSMMRYALIFLNTCLKSPASMLMYAVTILIFLKTCLPVLPLVVPMTIMFTTVYLRGQNRASDDDNNSGAHSGSRCHTCLLHLTDKTFGFERMMLAYMFWLVRHLPFRTAIGTAMDVHAGISCSYPGGFSLIMGGLSSDVTSWVLKNGGPNFVAQRKPILGLSFVTAYWFSLTMGGLCSYITTWLLKPGGCHFKAQRKHIGLIL